MNLITPTQNIMSNNDVIKFDENIDARISDIESEFGFSLTSKDKTDFARIREAINETTELMKQGRFSNGATRTNLWQRLNSCRGKLKNAEDKFYNERKERFERRQTHSAELRDKILETIEACEPESPLNHLLHLTGEVMSYLTPLGGISAGFGFLLKAFEMAMGVEREKVQNPLKIKSQALQEVRKLINDSRDLLTREHKDELFAKWNEVKESLDDAWTEFKEEREERNREWERKQRDFLAVLEERLEKKIAFVERQESRVDNQKAYLRKLEDRLENQRDYLQKKEDQLEKLEDDYSNAWSDSFREKCSDWIDETNDKIREVQANIDSLEEKIREIENEIDELPQKIKEAEDDIDSLREKIEEVKGRLNK